MATSDASLLNSDAALATRRVSAARALASLLQRDQEVRVLRRSAVGHHCLTPSPYILDLSPSCLSS